MRPEVKLAPSLLPPTPAAFLLQLPSISCPQSTILRITEMFKFERAVDEASPACLLWDAGTAEMEVGRGGGGGETGSTPAPTEPGSAGLWLGAWSQQASPSGKGEPYALDYSRGFPNRAWDPHHSSDTCREGGTEARLAREHRVSHQQVGGGQQGPPRPRARRPRAAPCSSLSSSPQFQGSRCFLGKK